ncbi:MAG: hypothetical protein Q9214_005274 [Letrouitia sp. 1 TL-2023]
MASTNAILDQASRSQNENVENVEIDVMLTSLQWLTSKIIEVAVGPDGGTKLHVHEGILFKSPGLKNMYLGASNKKKGRPNIPLTIPKWEAKDIGRLFQFLYHRKLDVYATKVEEQSRELEKLYRLAAHYEVKPMQTQALRHFEQLEIATKIAPISFLKLADRLYEHDIHPHLRQYFKKVAPAVLRKIASRDRPALDDMISSGGDFAQDLFHAYTKAMQPFEPADEPQVNIKCEDKGDDHHPRSQQSRVDVLTHTPLQAEFDSSAVTERIPWDDQNKIPTDIFSAGTTDKMLLTLAGLEKPWDEIAEAYERASGLKVPPRELAYRHTRLQANILDITSDDIERMIEAKACVERIFTKEKWITIAQSIVEKGGNYYPPARLERLSRSYEAKMQAEKGQEIAAARAASRDHKYEIEAVNGVRATNILPIDPRPRKQQPKRRKGKTQANTTRPRSTRKEAITPRKRGVSEVDSETESNISTPNHKYTTRRAKREVIRESAVQDNDSLIVASEDYQPANDRAVSVISDRTNVDSEESYHPAHSPRQETIVDVVEKGSSKTMQVE